jgi:site-specific DNA-methyltransferase (adenine-specific)
MDMKENQIIQGDCLIEMQKIEAKSIDMVLCDLPYGTTASKWDSILPSTILWSQYERIIKDNGAIVLFASGQFSPYLLSSNLSLFKYKYVWIKQNTTNFVHAKNRPMTEHEDILVFSKAPMGHTSQLGERRMIYNPQGLTEINKDIKLGNGRFGTIAGKRPSHKEVFKRTHTGYPTDVLWQFNEVATNHKLHTNEKPIPLLEYLIKTYTNEGDLVLDNAAGSGTTGVAARNLNRNFILIEKEPEYIKIINERLK